MFQLIPLHRQIRLAKGDEVNRSVIEKLSEALVLLEEAFINCSKGKAFFGGDNVGYLDIVLGSFVGWIRVDEVMIGTKFLDEAKTPRLVGWADRLYSDSLVKDVMLDPHTLLEALKKFQAMSKAASD